VNSFENYYRRKKFEGTAWGEIESAKVRSAESGGKSNARPDPTPVCLDCSAAAECGGFGFETESLVPLGDDILVYLPIPSDTAEIE
jgi:hypothetical protein